jgi:hypothetical protein
MPYGHDGPSEREQQQLAGLKSQNEYFRSELRKRDLAEADRLAAERAVKPVDYVLLGSQKRVTESLADPEGMEMLRQSAWLESSIYITKPPSADKGWPKGFDPTEYVRKFHGLNEAGTARIGESATAQDEVPAAKTFLDEALAAVMKSTTE